ncbi:MAG TPA: amino acid permease [Blastocatellia bacterium]|jgi:APA family basic amino acid/polyamine antiporter|nr:amino acid permease [Blastocatellia bacterium]
MDTKQVDKTSVSAMTFGGLFRIKTLDSILLDAEKPEYQLKRAIGPIQLTLFGIGAIIGAGIFATIGTATAGDANRPGAGPALMLSFVITAVVCGFTALCYSEFASMVPISGSAYTYSYATLGEVVAWIIGWDLIIEYAVGNIAVAISWANYFKTLMAGLGIDIPHWISMDYRTAAKVVDANGVQTVYRDAPHIFGFPIVFNILAILIVAAITIILIWGISESARFNAIMVGIKILVLTFFIIVGFYWVEPANWGLSPYNSSVFAPNGWAGISAGAAIIFFAYIGFDAVSTVAEETRDPQRNLPIGIMASLITCTIFYIVVSAVFTGLISYPELQAKLATEQAEPLTMALQHAVPNSGWAVGIVAFGSVIAHTAVLLVFQLGQPRIFFSMSRDGLLPGIFKKVHPKYRTPHISTILTGVFVGVFAAVASIDEMVDLTNIGTLFAFILVCAGIIVLRVKDPDRPRPFRVPSGWKWTLILYAGFAVGTVLFPMPVVAKVIILAIGAIVFALSRNYIFPVLGILSCLYLIYFLPPTSWLRFAAWLNLGFVIYVAYGSVHSRLTGRHTNESPAEHNAHTSYYGAWLGLIGTVLLFFMRWFDLWLEALKEHKDLAGTAKGGAAFADSLRASSWVDVSWFLIVPLMLNLLVLCPIVAQRALKARREGGAAGHGQITNISLVISTVIGLAILAYLILVGLHRAGGAG